MRTKPILTPLSPINRIHTITKLFSSGKAQRITFSALLLSAAVMTVNLNDAHAGFPLPPGLPAPPGVSVNINGYLPPPPGVHVRIDSGRPYYMERDRRVYMERDRRGKHYKKNKHHEDRGRKKGHYK
ncbi:MAG: hypothetical protein HIU83_09375 [Proteobacteria bacterium]|nr:hypothetical protein [Pseudomonadota bacterium]